MTDTAIAAALAAGLALGAAGAAWVQSQRYGLQIERLQHQQTTNQLKRADQAITDLAGFQKGLDDALQTFQQTQQRNAGAQQALDRSLRDLRGTAAGLRGDFAGLPQRIASAAQPALAEYASTCTAIFEAMAAGGANLAERGADIARAADGHAADARLLTDAWPRQRAPQLTHPGASDAQAR